MKRIIAAVLCIAWGNANAIPVLWSFEDAVFDDGGVITGSFVYDADTSQYSSVDIYTSSGSNFDGGYYASTLVYGPTSATFYADGSPPVAGDIYLGLVYSSLSNAGGNISLSTSSKEGYCTGLYYNCALGLSERQLTGGYISGSVVPVPAAFWLLSSALGFLGWVRRKSI